MSRLVWPLALAVTFAVGLVVGGVVLGGRLPGIGADDAQTVRRLNDQVSTLQARLRARESLATSRPPATTAPSPAAPDPAATERPSAGFAQDRPGASPAAGGVAPAASRTPAGGVSTPSGARVTTASVQTALDRFYRFIEATKSMPEGRERWQQVRELMNELRGMGDAGVQALMQVVTSGSDTDERRTAARMLGALKAPQALPVLRDIIEKDDDLLLRRSAAMGLRQLQTPESLPVMERIVHNANEDRYVRLSAAAGLADAGKPLGVSGLAHIFEESTADGRGRDLAFRALANLDDGRSLPFMRSVLMAQVEPAYRLRAIRYVTAQGDRQAVAALQVLMNSPNEQPSIRDAAAQAYGALSAR